MIPQSLRLPLLLGALALCGAASAVTTNAKLAALDGSENVCTASQMDVSSTAKSIRVVKRASSGTLLWARDYAPAANTVYTPTQVRADASGNVFVAGYSKSPTGAAAPQYLILKYGASGALLWSDAQSYSNAGYTDPQATGMDLDLSGNPVVVGTMTHPGAGDMMSFLVRYDGTGALARSTIYTVPGLTRTAIRAVDVDGNGRILVGGTVGNGTTGGGGMDYALFARFDDTLSRAADWIVSMAPNTACTGFALDASANAVESFVTADATGRPLYATVKKFDGTGASQLWSNQVSTAAFDASAGVIVDAGGSVVVGGAEQRASGGANTSGFYRLVRLSGADGSLQWNSEFGVGPNAAVATASLGQDAYGNYMVAGDYLRTDGVREVRIPFFTPSGGSGGYYYFAYSSLSRAVAAIPSATPGTLYVADRVLSGSSLAPYGAAVAGSSLLWWAVTTSPTP